MALSSAVGWAWLTALVPLVLHLKDPNGMGGGDVKLSFLCGVGFGALGPGLLGCAACLAVAVSAIRALLRGRQVLDSGLAFGPYLAAGAVAALLAG